MDASDILQQKRSVLRVFRDKGSVHHAEPKHKMTLHLKAGCVYLDKVVFYKRRSGCLSEKNAYCRLSYH